MSRMSFQASDSDISDDSGEDIWDREDLEASLEAETDSDDKTQSEKTIEPKTLARRSKKKHKLPKRNHKSDPLAEKNNIREAETMMKKLSSRSVRDVVGQHLKTQPPIVALNLVNNWFSFWRRQILSTRQNARRISFKSRQILLKCESKSIRSMDYFNRENSSKLHSLYILETEFSEEDKASMLECFSRNFPKYSKQILRKILENSNYHLYLSVNNLLHWRAEGHPLIFRGTKIETSDAEQQNCCHFF